MNVYLSIAAIVLYCAASGLQITQIKHRSNPSWAKPLGFLAVVVHALAALTAIYTPNGIDLGLTQTLSLISWVICLVTLSVSLRRPIHNLLVVLYPLAALFLLAEIVLPANHDIMKHVSPGVFSHIIFSILAYSVLSVAAAQALVLALQDKRLKEHRLLGLASILPPLQTMEAMLFELIWAGFALLTLAIGSGVLYIENLFAQHLAHKTVFSILAWVLFAILLWGRTTLGWRSHTAIRWTLWAFGCLMLAYVGTQVVLQWIIG